MELPKSNIKRSYLVNVIGPFNENKLKEIDNKIKLKGNEAADFAIESKLPDEAELFKDIIIE